MAHGSFLPVLHWIIFYLPAIPLLPSLPVAANPNPTLLLRRQPTPYDVRAKPRELQSASDSASRAINTQTPAILASCTILSSTYASSSIRLAAAAALLQSSAVFQLLMPRAAPHEMMLPSRVPHEMMMGPAAAPAFVKEPRLSDFDKVGDLGAGSCGVVTKVRLRSSGAVFALKTAYYPDSNAEEEAEALCRAGGSPNIVRCHAVFRGDADEPAMLLELMDAGSLGRVLCRRGGRGLPEPALAEVAARCLGGLTDLHSRGVAHLDLKPDNLLANARGDVKIGDFSVSRIFLGGAGERLKVSIAVGSTAYMSPERFAPNARAGPRGACAADIWGLGITVLELFLGRCPILPGKERPSWEMLMEAICYGELPSVPESTAASSALRGFVAACLQKDPSRRATVAQLLAHPFISRRDVQASRRALREIVVETM